MKFLVPFEMSIHSRIVNLFFTLVKNVKREHVFIGKCSNTAFFIRADIKQKFAGRETGFFRNHQHIGMVNGSVPLDETNIKKMERTLFGFHIEFLNKVRLSTIWGPGTFTASGRSSLRNDVSLATHLDKSSHIEYSSDEVEVAIFNACNEGYPEYITQEYIGYDCKEVIPDVPLMEWIFILEWCRTYDT